MLTKFTKLLQLTNPSIFETFMMHVERVQNDGSIQIMQVGLEAVKSYVTREQISSNFGLLWAYPSSSAQKKI